MVAYNNTHWLLEVRNLKCMSLGQNQGVVRGMRPLAGFREGSVFSPFPISLAPSTISKVSRVLSSILSLFYCHIAFSVTRTPPPAFLLKGHPSLHLGSSGIIQYNLITSAKSHLLHKVTLRLQGLEFGYLWGHYSAYHTWRWWMMALFSWPKSTSNSVPSSPPQTICISQRGCSVLFKKFFIFLHCVFTHDFLFVWAGNASLPPWSLPSPFTPAGTNSSEVCAVSVVWFTCGCVRGFLASLLNCMLPPCKVSPPQNPLPAFHMGSFGKWHINYFHRNDRTGEGFEIDSTGYGFVIQQIFIVI